MAKTNLTIPVKMRYQKRRMTLAMALMRWHLPRLSVWLLNGTRFDVKVGNMDWKEYGRVVVSYDE